MTEGSSRHHRFTVAQYYRMAEAGALAPDVRVELIEGEIIDMAPIGSRHAYYVRELDNLLRRAVSDRAVVQCQSPVRLSDISEPQPDLALLKPPAGAYKERHPGAGDSLLLIEVSDSTFRDDRRVKVPLYARHGIPEVWLVDAVECAVHLFRSPLQGSYRQTSIARVGERLVIAALGDVAVDLSDILSS